jgi:hypothetical protein
MPLRLLLAAVMISTVARAQDVHVRVSPDVKTGIESTTEYPTIQMALDHHPFAGVDPDGKPSRVFIEIAPGTYHFYAEVENSGPGWRPKERTSWSHQLTSAEAKQYLPKTFLAGPDHWDPVAEAKKLP